MMADEQLFSRLSFNILINVINVFENRFVYGTINTYTRQRILYWKEEREGGGREVLRII